MIHARGTLVRTVERFAMNPMPTRYFVKVMNGRALIGSESKHLTRHGVKYNKILQLWGRLHKD